MVGLFLLVYFAISLLIGKSLHPSYPLTAAGGFY